jgi:ubiquinone/menaquinone biosynthesis C-methylase UbiE
VIEYQRRLVVPRAKGRVLEIGFGSGLNLEHYDRTQVEWIWALEPSAPMRALAAPRLSRSNLDVRLIDFCGEDLPLPDESVDSVVMTYTLCTIPGATAALKQMRCVLRPVQATILRARCSARCRRASLARSPRSALEPPGRRLSFESPDDRLDHFIGLPPR